MHECLYFKGTIYVNTTYTLYHLNMDNIAVYIIVHKFKHTHKLWIILSTF